MIKNILNKVLPVAAVAAVTAVTAMLIFSFSVNANQHPCNPEANPNGQIGCVSGN